LKLYYAPGACSLAVHIALREAGLPFELARVDLAQRRVEGGTDLAAVNPRGYVPVLEFGGGHHTEAAALLQHVGELAPASGLLPAAGTAERLEVTKWLTFVATELHKTLGALWNPAVHEATRQTCLDVLARRLPEVERALAGRAHLAGSRFTAADAYAFAILGWTRMLGIPLDPYPRLQAWMGRVAARPAVLAALQAEGLVPA